MNLLKSTIVLNCGLVRFRSSPPPYTYVLNTFTITAKPFSNATGVEKYLRSVRLLDAVAPCLWSAWSIRMSEALRILLGKMCKWEEKLCSEVLLRNVSDFSYTFSKFIRNFLIKTFQWFFSPAGNEFTLNCICSIQKFVFSAFQLCFGIASDQNNIFMPFMLQLKSSVFSHSCMVVCGFHPHGAALLQSCFFLSCFGLNCPVFVSRKPVQLSLENRCFKLGNSSLQATHLPLVHLSFCVNWVTSWPT